MSRMTYISPSGKVIDLVAPGDWVRAVSYGGVTGLVGTKTATTLQAVSVPGRTPTTFQTTEMKGELTLLVVDAPGRATIDGLVAEINREFSPDVYGTLVLERPETVGRLTTRVRLDGPISFPQSFLDAGDVQTEVKIPLISDEGLWTQAPLTGRGTVTVTNNGDEFLWPRVQWSTSSTLELPSGVKMILPPAADGKARSLSLDPYTSHEVTRVDTGLIDPSLSATTATLLLGEGVPKGQTRTYRTTGDATVMWAPQYLNPWR